MQAQSRYRIIAPHVAHDNDIQDPEGQGIGEGAYGKVYKAIDLLTNTEVALKKIKTENEVDGISSSTLREITYLRQLKHENIVVLRDVVWQTAGRISLIFPLEECDLSKLLSQNPQPFPTDLVQCYGAQILSAIAYCHSMGVMHRDLKPQNILVGKDGQLKLADFGLARAISPMLRPLTIEVITRWYRAPEVLMGHKYYEQSVDVWSAACIICEMSNRSVLFKGYSDIDQIHTIFRLLGTPTSETWPGLEDVPYWRGTYPDWPARVMESYLPRMGPEGVDLVAQILRYDPKTRLTAKAALLHPFIRPFHRTSRAPSRVTPTSANVGLLQNQSQQRLGQSNALTAVSVPVEGRVPPVSRCASALDIIVAPVSQSSEMQSAAAAVGLASRVVFQPIRSTSEGVAAVAGSSSAAPAVSVAVDAPVRPATSNAASSAQVPLALPFASRAQRSESTSSNNSGAAAAVPSAPVRAAGGMVTSTSSNHLHQDLVMESDAAEYSQLTVETKAPEVAPAQEKIKANGSFVALPIASNALVRVTVPVRTVAPRKDTVALAAAAGNNTAPARRSSARNKQAVPLSQETQPVIELFEPPTKARRVTQQCSSAETTAEDATEDVFVGATRSRNDSDTSGMSFLSSSLELELELDSSLDFPEDEDAAMMVVEMVSADKLPTEAVVLAQAQAPAAAIAPKGRAGKRKFGGMSPSLELVPATAPIAAAISRVNGSAQRPAAAPATKQAPRVTPEVAVSTTSPLYWGAPTPYSGVASGGIPVVGGSVDAVATTKAQAPRSKGGKGPTSASLKEKDKEKAKHAADMEAVTATAGSTRRSQRGRA